jgi:predicted dehydrogenase
MRCYRLHGPIGSFASPPRPEGISETMYQIQRFHSFLWASGGCYSDFYIHNIDELCWLKDAWPVAAHGLGGRHYRQEDVDQNFDSYSVEYDFEDGTKLFMLGRCINGCENHFAGYVHGSKGLGTIESMHRGEGICGTYNGQKKDPAAAAWRSPLVPNPYQLEWDNLIQAIREDLPYNETRRGVIASLVTSMGRMAAHTGKTVTYDQLLNSDHEFAPGVAELTMDGPAPLNPDAEGKYPVPMPGLVTSREY